MTDQNPTPVYRTIRIRVEICNSVYLIEASGYHNTTVDVTDLPHFEADQFHAEFDEAFYAAIDKFISDHPGRITR